MVGMVLQFTFTHPDGPVGRKQCASVRGAFKRWYGKVFSR